jgi:hypothetical protein
MEQEYDSRKYSKTNLPPDIDVALNLTPLPGKGQDHVDFFVTDNGNIGIIVCDGVSGDGPLSSEMAQQIPRSLSKTLESQFVVEMSITEWQELLEIGLRRSIEEYSHRGGSSTILVGVIDKVRDLIYIGWMGDGHIVYFNEELTGYSKLLTPHQNKEGQLTRVVTSQGLLGKPSTQILSGSGGALILASDGYNLSNGRILRHLYQKALKSKNIEHDLSEWVMGNCEDEKLHPTARDDKSIGIIRWGVIA